MVRSILLMTVSVVLAAQSAFATVHDIPYNTATSVTLADGDELKLSAFPAGWGYSRVLLGVNAEAGATLSGSISHSGCVYSLDGYYEQVDFPYSGEALLRYSGPSQTLPLQWWVDASPVTSSCTRVEMTHEDSLKAAFSHALDSVVDLRMKPYTDLGALNSELAFEGTSGHFSITDFPSDPYNLIYVQITSKDGLPLDGGFYTGGQKTELLDSSQTITLERRHSGAATFILNFPEYRSISIKWWAAFTPPTQTEIATVKDTLADSSVAVEYAFPNTPYNRSKALRLVFDPSAFEDGKVPTIQKYSHSPQGLIAPNDSLSIQGAVYDIHAELKAGRKVTVALPVNMDSASLSVVSVDVLHFNDSLNVWTVIAPDSIRDGYVYFQASSFSWHSIRNRIIPAGVACALSSGLLCTDPGTVSTVVTGAVTQWGSFYVAYSVEQTEAGSAATHYFLGTTYRIIQSIFDKVCGKSEDEEKKFQDFYSLSQTPNTNVGELSKVAPPNPYWMYKLIKLSSKQLEPLSDAGDDDEVKRWDITKNNVDILFADMLLSKMTDGRSSRFEIKRDTTDGQMFVQDYIMIAKDSLQFFSVNPYQLRTCMEKRGMNKLSHLDSLDIQERMLRKNYRDAFENIMKQCYIKCNSSSNSGVANEDCSTCDSITSAFNRLSENLDCRDSLNASWIMFRSISGDTSSFSSVQYDFSDYFASYSELFANTDLIAETATSCTDVASYVAQPVAYSFQQKLKALRASWKQATGNGSFSETCRAVVSSILHVDQVSNDVQCLDDGLQILNNQKLMDMAKEHSGILLSATDVFNRLALMMWYSSDYREALLDKYLELFVDMGTWVNFVSPVFGNNNISIKAYSGLSLYEYMRYGTLSEYDKVKEAMQLHFGDNGGFSEGTGYLQYIMEDVPYVLVALRNAVALDGGKLSINDKFMKAGGYLANMSRDVSGMLIPVEADDGCTYAPDFAVWANLANSRFGSLAHRYPLDTNKITPMSFLGLPDSWDTTALFPERTEDRPWGGVMDGTVLIQALSPAGDTLSLSMVSESGNLWKRGMAHDQQDNQSVTLASSRDGFILQDRGYAGFDARKDRNFHLFIDHNVLAYPVPPSFLGGESDNYKMNWGDAVTYLKSVMNIDLNVSAFWQVLLKEFDMDDYQFATYGGAPAEVVDSLSAEGILGYTSEHVSTGVMGFVYDTVHVLRDSSSDSLVISSRFTNLYNVDNHRTILYFGENFFIVDRPDSAGLAWLANSPKSNWKNLNVNLYGSDTVAMGMEVGKEILGDKANIKQNGSRADYHVFADTIKLLNYSFSIRDSAALTYVAAYSADTTLVFLKTAAHCPANMQCLQNASGTLRLVVPPKGAGFRLLDAFDHCSLGDSASGIVLGSYKSERNTWTFNIIDGRFLTGDGYVARSITASDDGVSYVYESGSSMAGSAIEYLPALPLLLLR